jgi:hypothetical protein
LRISVKTLVPLLKREVAFRGLMNYAHDRCMLNGDVQKEKYVYYRGTSHRSKCDLARFREEEIADRLGECTLRRIPPKERICSKSSVRTFPVDAVNATPAYRYPFNVIASKEPK